MPYTILLIEDQEEMRMVIEATLELAGYSVAAVANGREAKRVLETQTVDLVLTDLLMPEKDGIEVITDLRRKNPEMPIIAMSGGGRMSAVIYLDLARKLGARTVLQKPFEEALMLEEIKKALP